MSTYTELFSIEITHDYYTDEICPDFRIEPTPECQELLQGHHMIVKNKVNGIQLVTPLDSDNSVLIDLPGGSKFTFYMKLNEPAFGNYTNLSPIGEGLMYGYNNEGIGSGDLTLAGVDKSKVQLPVNDVDIFAMIDISYDELSTDLTLPSQYTIPFTAQAINWNYYFITNKDHGKTLKVEHDTITFNEENVNGDPTGIGQELQEKYPDNDVYLFRSDTLINYQEEGIKNITLNAYVLAVPEAIIEHLPNPSIYDYGIKMLKTIIQPIPV